MAYQDKSLECKECGKQFVWTASEQEFFAKKGFKNVPARCPECRKQARQKRIETQVSTPVKCSQCGKTGEVPFEPEGAKIYCEQCFNKLRLKQKSS